MPPPSPPARFPLNRVALTLVLVVQRKRMPPPLEIAEFPMSLQPSNCGPLAATQIPPPSAAAVFSMISHFERRRREEVPVGKYSPPPPPVRMAELPWNLT